MQKVTIELFLYDRFMLKDNIQRHLKAEILEYSPAFLFGQLKVTGTKYNRKKHLFIKKTRNKPIFGIYTKLNIKPSFLDVLNSLNVFEEKELKEVSIKTIQFDSMENFLNSDFKIISEKKVFAYVSHNKKLSKSTRNFAGNFDENFFLI